MWDVVREIDEEWFIFLPLDECNDFVGVPPGQFFERNILGFDFPATIERVVIRPTRLGVVAGNPEMFIER